ncbi:hypothetical protein ADILRU_0428 [Leifsonia rubra CMS 76R]|nr:hypothetical protein ADILRU_0428 [Leifsonia rubra CMS 76R]
MGSGHFLVAAVDKIESKMRSFIADPETQVPGINEELSGLALAARDALGDDETAKDEVEPTALLRRQIARRCIYGLDINPLAVELSRLALWIHTFVPGLPMSSLNHGLVCANSLTGIGTIDEALDALQPKREPGQATLFDGIIENNLITAKSLLVDAANASEASKKEVHLGLELARQAKEAAEPTRLIFNAAVAARLGLVKTENVFTEDELTAVAESEIVAQVGAQLQPAHMPFLFPEVFIRDNAGFDVLLGNPPWEKAKVETTRWWAIRFPGLRSQPQGQQDALVKEYRSLYPIIASQFDDEVQSNAALRKVLLAGPYRGLGTGDPDLYQAFAWRNFQLLRTNGRAGLVTPRSLISESGSAEWRNEVFDRGEFSDVTLLLNSGRWVFDIHAQYTIAAISLKKTKRGDRSVRLSGPFASMKEFESRDPELVAEIPATEFRTWNTGAAFPILPDALSGEIYRQMQKHPRLDAIGGNWRARPFSELHSTNDKALYNLSSKPEGSIPVYKGESLDLWVPDTGKYYASTDPEFIAEVLQAKRLRQAATKSSPYSEFSSETINDPSTLPMLHPRIAIRKITNRTNSRTILSALIPPNVTITEGAPFILWPSGGKKDEAFLLGVLSSIIFDWAARRTVEINVTYHILNGLPVPRPDLTSALWLRVVETSGRIAAIDDRFDEWASLVGVPVGGVAEPSALQALVAELDALVALLYGLNEEQTEHIFRTFHRGWDYRPRLENVLEYYAQWKDQA